MTNERIAVCVLAVATLVFFTLFRLERADHEVTRANLERVRTENAVLRDSAANAATSVKALKEQLKAMADARVQERELAAKRETVLKGVKTVPAKEAGVVDIETSKKAVRHINETLRRNAGY